MGRMRHALGGIHFAYVLDSKGSGRSVDAGGTGRWAPDQGVLWVELDRHAPETPAWLAKVAALDPLAVESILAHEPRPRAVTQDNGLLVTLRGVNLNEGDAPEDMVALRGWFDASRAILLRGRRVAAVEDVRKSVLARGGPTGSADVLVRIVDALTDTIAERADDLSTEADGLEELSHGGEVSPDLRVRIGRLRSRCITMRRHISPQRDMVGRLASEPVALLTPSDRARLRENAEQLARAVEELDLVRERLLIAQEQLGARVNERLSRNTYLLSILAAVFLPVGFLTALAGVSIAGLPGKDDPEAFWWLCGILGGLILLELLVLRRMRLL
jgi:zinc transporter